MGKEGGWGGFREWGRVRGWVDKEGGGGDQRVGGVGNGGEIRGWARGWGKFGVEGGRGIRRWLS